MIKSIHFQNFKSLKELTFNIMLNKNDNHLYLIYGENGSGKTNIIYAFALLDELTNSLNWAEKLEAFMLKGDGWFDQDLLNYRSIEQRLKPDKRIGSTDNMVLQYTFVIDGEEYVYRISFDNQRIVNESLRAPLSKNQVEAFNIDYNKDLSIALNDNLFTKVYRDDIEEKLRKYFGKHSLLSLVKHDNVQANVEYIKENTNKKLLRLIDYIDDLSVLMRDKPNIINQASHNVKTKSIIKELSSGTINTKNEKKLDKTEELLNIYFKALYSDIKKTWYERKYKDKKINYKLYFNKMIGGDLTTIPASLESRGTKQLLNLFPYLIKLLEGGIVIIDEFATGVHDVLTTMIIERLEEYKIPGQLIATTHNTMLLDSINKNRIFILDIDDRGNKGIYSLKNSGVRIQPNHSIYNNYKKGTYGGIPIPGHFDFGDLKACLDEE